MKTHIFSNICINFDELLKEANLDKMLKAAYKQSKTEEAKKRTDVGNYKDYDTNEWNPKYFGMFSEWLCWHYLNHFGYEYNIHSTEMTDSVDGNTEDYGIDGVGLSIKRQLLQKTARCAQANSPVYIQVKGTMNKTKIYLANDGSRIPNFGLNAMSEAIKTGRPQQARYIVFTTGQGSHYTLEDKMANGLFEVIGYNEISKRIKNNTVFLNRLRASVNLAEFPITLAPLDPVSAQILTESVV